MQASQSLEQVISSDRRIALLETQEAAHYLTLFKRLTLTSGRAVYDWNPESGLYRLGIEHIFIPRTRTPADVLAYIASSRHYGVYLLRDIGTSLDTPSVQRQLLKLLEKQDGIKRLVFMLGENLALPASLSAHAVQVQLPPLAEQNAG
jgi:hypothetical protein